MYRLPEDVSLLDHLEVTECPACAHFLLLSCCVHVNICIHDCSVHVNMAVYRRYTTHLGDETKGKDVCLSYLYTQQPNS